MSFQVTTENWAEFPVLYGRFSLLIYFIHGSVYTSVPISQFIPPLFPSWYPYIFSLRFYLYFCFANNFIHIVFLDFTYKRYYMVSVFLSDLLHFVLQSLGLSMSLQMAQFHSFFVTNIPMYIYTTSSLSIPLLMDNYWYFWTWFHSLILFWFWTWFYYSNFKIILYPLLLLFFLLPSTK